MCNHIVCEWRLYICLFSDCKVSVNCGHGKSHIEGIPHTTFVVFALKKVGKIERTVRLMLL